MSTGAFNQNTHEPLFIKVQIDTETRNSEDPDWRAMGVDRPESGDVSEAAFVWLGVSPMVDVRFIFPEDNGQCTMQYRDGERVRCYAEPDTVVRGIAHAMSKGKTKLGSNW